MATDDNQCIFLFTQLEKLKEKEMEIERLKNKNLMLEAESRKFEMWKIEEETKRKTMEEETKRKSLRYQYLLRRFK